MKKLLILFLAFGLAACGRTTNEDSNSSTTEKAEHEHVETDKEPVTQEESTTEESPDQHEEHSATEESHDQHEEHSTTEEGHDHHVEGVTVELVSGELKHGKATSLKVKVNKDGQPLNDINVKLEMTRGEGLDPIWVTVPFAKEGLYEVKHTFSEAGEYEVVIHLSDGKDLHDHFEQTVSVQ